MGENPRASAVRDLIVDACDSANTPIGNPVVNGFLVEFGLVPRWSGRWSWRTKGRRKSAGRQWRGFTCLAYIDHFFESKGMRVKQEVQELFPTPLWIVDLAAADAASFNAKLKAEIENIISPRPKVPSGSNWQTPQDLHTRPAFADFTKLVEITARSVAQYLEVERFPMMITGCWANINSPGAYHPTHNHPNNYLSGVYYVAVPEGGPALVFQDPRPVLMMPWTGKLSRVTANAAVAQPQPGRMVLFPSWLRHHVPSNQGTTERISISFNLMFTNFAETLAAPRWKPTAGTG